MDWQLFLSALALMMIFEGISPFLMPDRMRKLAQLVMQANDRSIRIVGLASMLTGLGLLYWVRGW